MKQIGKEAATHRFTLDEKNQLADIEYTYKRQGIRTSENEITRIAINYFIEDYRKNGEESLLQKSLNVSIRDGMIPWYHDTMIPTMQPWCNLALDSNLIDLFIWNVHDSSQTRSNHSQNTSKYSISYSLPLPRDTATAIPSLSGVSWVMNGLAGLGTLTPDTSCNGSCPILSG